ncbi:MAG: aspartoacylase [Candidatus Fibromonas sp.]|jgi:succinylglutamate desuccinylase|nr:aspartoacylase [Candidatus Fibromonas sp.]
MEPIHNIVICGGTHGNELTGVYLAKKHGWLLANPAAAALCRRYLNRDLNRCFALSELKSRKNSSGELARAREINTLLGKKGTKTAPDLILDIHNTTANMGITLILSSKEDPALLAISKVIAKEFKDVHIYLQPESREESPYLGTIAKRDICIEAGPQPHGTLDAELFFKVERVVFRLLELVEALNDGVLPKAGDKIETFTETRSIDYPRDAKGNITAMVHPALQGRDFCELKAGMPVFMGFDGKEILWQGETCYPAFINEAAYYEKGVAMLLTLSGQGCLG